MEPAAKSNECLQMLSWQPSRANIDYGTTSGQACPLLIVPKLSRLHGIIEKHISIITAPAWSLFN